jgi:hypothetical protein
MKNLLKIFFCLINFVFINAYNININRRSNPTFDYDKFYEGLSDICIEEQDNSEYNECMENLNTDNYKQICSTFKSEKCQNFFNNPLDYFPICKNDTNIKEYYQPAIMDYIKISYELICIYDENDNLCPFGLSVITESGADKFIRDTCKSKICTNSTIEVCKKMTMDKLLAYENSPYTKGKFTYKELNSYKKIIEVLESEECKNENVTSKANSIYINIILLFLLNIILLLNLQ